jgi:hypothetical protein
MRPDPAELSDDAMGDSSVSRLPVSDVPQLVEARDRRRQQILAAVLGIVLVVAGLAIWSGSRPSATVLPPDDGAATAPPAAQPVVGRLPDGQRYEIVANDPLNEAVEGISAGTVVELPDGAGGELRRPLGIASFQPAPSSDAGGVNPRSGTVTVHSAVMERLGDTDDNQA